MHNIFCCMARYCMVTDFYHFVSSCFCPSKAEGKKRTHNNMLFFFSFLLLLLRGRHDTFKQNNNILIGEETRSSVELSCRRLDLFESSSLHLSCCRVLALKGERRRHDQWPVCRVVVSWHRNLKLGILYLSIQRLEDIILKNVSCRCAFVSR
jgi:hypothetical protein